MFLCRWVLRCGLLYGRCGRCSVVLRVQWRVGWRLMWRTRLGVCSLVLRRRVLIALRGLMAWVTWLTGFTGLTRRPLRRARRFSVGGRCALSRTFLCAARVDDGAAAGEFGRGGFQVFRGHCTGWLSVQVETLRLARQGQHIGRAGGVAVQKTRQGLAREDARRTGLDVGLNAQLQRQRLLQAEQGREQLGQTR